MDQTLPNIALTSDITLTGGKDQVRGPRRYSALLHNYYLHGICPIRFGPQQDIIATLLIIFGTIVLLHGALWTWSTSQGNRVWNEYADSSQFLVGVIVYLWVVGYNVVSWVIWYQFERTEAYPADDYYMVRTGEGVGEGQHSRLESGGPNRAQPILVQLPNDQLAVGLKS